MLDWSKIIEASNGLSHAQISSAAEVAAKRVVMGGETLIESADIVQALESQDRRSLSID